MERPRAVAIVASRYLRPGKESSVRALLERVGTTLAGWVAEEEYGAELMRLLLAQRGAFNSPVWFNVGIDDPPQCSACFILSVEDDAASRSSTSRASRG